MSIAGLQLNTNNTQVTTGGGFIGGGFGVRGAIAGIATATALNSVSRQRYEYTVLIAHETLPNGARRDVTFAFATLSESQLRDRLAEGVAPWTESYVTTMTKDPDPFGTGEDLQASYDQIDRMRQRGMLNPAQALSLSSHVSRPFLTAILERLDAQQVAFPEAQHLTERIATLEREGHLNPDQARQVHDRLLQIPVPVTNSPDGRIQQLQTLAELRASGALTEDEFQAEKTRILRHHE